MKREKAIKKALLVALEELHKEYGEALCRVVRPIVWQNHENGRVENFLDQKETNSAKKYVFDVADFYIENSNQVFDLIKYQKTTAWQSFLVDLKKFCFVELQGYEGLPSYKLPELSQEYAIAAAVEIAKGGYVFDRPWLGWVRVVVHNVCAKGARTAAADKNKMIDQAFGLEHLEKHLADSEQTYDLATSRDKILDLRHAILEHCTDNEIIYIQKKYIFGWSDAAIGREIGFSQPVMSRMHKQILEKLRGLL